MFKPNEVFIDIDLYRDGFYLVWPVNSESAEKWFNSNFIPDEPQSFPSLDTLSSAIAVLGRPNVIFLTSWKKNDPLCISDLAHECLHITNHILQSKGVKEAPSCDEVQCYMLTFIMEKCIHFLNKPSRKKRPSLQRRPSS